MPFWSLTSVEICAERLRVEGTVVSGSSTAASFFVPTMNGTTVTKIDRPANTYAYYRPAVAGIRRGRLVVKAAAGHESLHPHRQQVPAMADPHGAYLAEFATAWTRSAVDAA